MVFKKCLSLIIIICLLCGVTGCGTLDAMKGLKEDNKRAKGADDLSDFAIIDDGVTDAGDGAVETITVASDVKTKDIIAYYEDKNGFVVPVKTKIPWEEGIAKAIVKNLVKGSEVEKRIAQSGFCGVVPEGTEVLGMSIKDGVCRIDFSKNILNTESYEQEANMVSALTYTLTEFDTIAEVEIMVEGQILPTLSKGYAADVAFERKNINLKGTDSGVNYTVFFKSPETEVAGYYVPITFTAEAVENPAVTVMEKLFNGPPEDLAVSNQIPYGVSFQGIKIEGDKAILDLGMGAINLSQEEYDEMNQIVVLCLNQFENIADVDFKIEGMSFEEAGLSFEDTNVQPVFNEY